MIIFQYSLALILHTDCSRSRCWMDLGVCSGSILFTTNFSVFMHYSSNRKTASQQPVELSLNLTNIVLTGGWPVLFHPTHISTLFTKATATATRAVCIRTASGDIVAACQWKARFQLYTLCWTQLLKLHTMHSIDQHSNYSFVWCKWMCITT